MISHECVHNTPIEFFMFTQMTSRWNVTSLDLQTTKWHPFTVHRSTMCRCRLHYYMRWKQLLENVWALFVRLCRCRRRNACILESFKLIWTASDWWCLIDERWKIGVKPALMHTHSTCIWVYLCTAFRGRKQITDTNTVYSKHKLNFLKYTIHTAPSVYMRNQNVNERKKQHTTNINNNKLLSLFLRLRSSSPRTVPFIAPEVYISYRLTAKCNEY